MPIPPIRPAPPARTSFGGADVTPATAALPLPANAAPLPPQRLVRVKGTMAWLARPQPLAGAQAAAMGEPPLGPAQQANITAFLQKLFAPYVTESNSDAIDALVRTRAAVLAEKRYTVEKLERMFDFATTVDTLAAFVAGAAGSLGFASANLIGQTYQGAIAYPAAKGAAAGGTTFVLSELLGKMSKEITAHTPWTQPKPDELKEVIARALADRKKSTASQIMEAGIPYQAFPVCFIASAVIATIVASMSGIRDANAAKNILNPMASLIAGGIAAVVRRNYFDEPGQLAGPALLLASKEWDTLLEQLSDATYKSTIAHGVHTVSGGFTGRAKKGLNTAFEGLALPSTWLKALLPFAGGFTGNAALSAWFGDLAREHNASPAGAFGAENIASAANFSFITLLWSLIGLFSEEIDNAIQGPRQPDSDRTAAAASSGVGPGPDPGPQPQSMV
jgi:hypothetical protein